MSIETSIITKYGFYKRYMQRNSIFNNTFFYFTLRKVIKLLLLKLFMAKSVIYKQ